MQKFPAASMLCRSRPKCEVIGRRVARKGGEGVLEVVDVRIPHAPDAGDGIVRCDRREYWLVGVGGHRLVATDCETQYGADNPGPAETAVADDRLTLRYLEHKSSDGCETYTAVVNLRSFKIESEERMRGDAEKDKCVRLEKDSEVVPPGDGSPDRPLVTLHP